MLDNSQIIMGGNIAIAARSCSKKIKWACQAKGARGTVRDLWKAWVT